MSQLAISDLSKNDIFDLCQNVRQSDIDELQASCGLSPEDVLLKTYALDGVKLAFKVDSEILCAFGVTDLLDSQGIPWMIASKNLSDNKKSFLKACKVIFPELKKHYQVMENYVDARNMDSIKWLEWLGFEVFDPVTFGLEKLPFHRFRMVN